MKDALGNTLEVGDIIHHGTKTSYCTTGIVRGKIVGFGKKNIVMYSPYDILSKKFELDMLTGKPARAQADKVMKENP